MRSQLIILINREVKKTGKKRKKLEKKPKKNKKGEKKNRNQHFSA